MPRLFAGAIALGLAIHANVPGKPVGTDTVQVRRPFSAAAHTFRVATYNVQHGTDQRGRYDLQRTIRTIASLRANLVGVQELVRNHAGFNCDDQPALVADGLTRLTGRHWRHVYVNEWVTDNHQCQDSGRGDGVETEGLAIFTDEPSLHVDHIRLWATRVGLSARVPSLTQLPVIVTHLASGTTEGRAAREKQLADLLPWADTQGAMHILMGDFNAGPDAPELRSVFRGYHDAWAQGLRRPWLLSGDRLGGTRAGRSGRIDYVFFVPDPRLRLTRVELVNTAGFLNPWESSDHRPVVAAFDVGRGR